MIIRKKFHKLFDTIPDSIRDTYGSHEMEKLQIISIFNVLRIVNYELRDKKTDETNIFRRYEYTVFRSILRDHLRYAQLEPTRK